VTDRLAAPRTDRLAAPHTDRLTAPLRTDRLAALSASVASSRSSSVSSNGDGVVPLHASPSLPVLPHHKLIAFSVAKELLLSVLRCSIRDAKLRDEAVRSAKSACLNCAEGAGRVTRADKARSFAIARAEAVEAAAAVEIAALCGDAPAERAHDVAHIASRLVALLTGLVR
jgi:four helix bundle protein